MYANLLCILFETVRSNVLELGRDPGNLMFMWTSLRTKKQNPNKADNVIVIDVEQIWEDKNFQLMDLQGREHSKINLLFQPTVIELIKDHSRTRATQRFMGRCCHNIAIFEGAVSLSCSNESTTSSNKKARNKK